MQGQGQERGQEQVQGQGQGQGQEQGQVGVGEGPLQGLRPTARASPEACPAVSEWQWRRRRGRCCGLSGARQGRG